MLGARYGCFFGNRGLVMDESVVLAARLNIGISQERLVGSNDY
jgi:hypothetical protein